MPISYRDAGVDIEAGERLVDRIKPLAAATRTPNVLEGVGGFAGLCRLPEGIDDPVLVSGTDGVGTKLRVAFATGVHGSVGQDLVAMCVNDVITTGAEPLFFLDYFACGKLDVGVAEQVVSGIAAGCRAAGCALLGGETAELPGFYADGEYELAGFAVGVASRRALLGPERVQVGDELVGVASSGLHSNGYSLARRVLEAAYPLDAEIPELGQTLGAALLTPTRIYASAVASLREELGAELHALSHVTGGGLPGNVPRVLPDGVVAELALPGRPPIFRLIQRLGPVEEDEMRRTFNLGVGLVCVVAGGAAERTIARLERAGETAFVLGRVVAGEGPGPATTRIAGD